VGPAMAGQAHSMADGRNDSRTTAADPAPRLAADR
jgi:hypothetical protein